MKLNEIEKMKKYIERTKLNNGDGFSMSMKEAFELVRSAQRSDFPVDVISFAFTYGKAKGYRAAKAEARR